MASKEFKFDKFIGLYSNVNAFSRAPQGSFKILDNVSVVQPGLLEPRRGFSTLVPSAASATINSLTSFLPQGATNVGLSTILGHSPGLGEFFYYQNSTFGLAPILYGSNWFQGGIQPYANARSRFVQYGFNGYATSGIGTWKTETGNSFYHSVLPQLNVGFGPNNVYLGSVASDYGSYGVVTTAASGNWFAGGYCVAYKFLVIRKDSAGNSINNTIVSGPPSDFTVVANTSTTTSVVTLTLQNSILLQPSDIIQIYRTKSAPILATGAEASCNIDFYLVAEVQPNLSTPQANGYLSPESVQTFAAGNGTHSVTFVDIVPDGALYFPLYTNPDDGGGAQVTTQTPPAAADLCLYKGVMYAGNTQDCHNFTLTITGTGTSGPTLIPGTVLTIDGYSYTFALDKDSNPDANGPNQTVLYSGGVGNGIQTIVTIPGVGPVITVNTNVTSGGVPGGPFGNSTYSFNATPGGYSIVINNITISSTAIGVVADATALANLINGNANLNTVVVAVANLAGNGSVKVSALSGGGTPAASIEYTTRYLGNMINLRYAQLIASGSISAQQALTAEYLPGSTPGAVGSLYITRYIPGPFPFTLSSSSPNGFGNNFVAAGASDNNTQVAGLRFSPLNEPDVFPLENEEIIGSEGVAILRLVSTRDGMWIFKDEPDGLFLFTDSGGNTNLASFDPTVLLLAPDACCVMDNDVYSLCVDGVMLIDQQGKENISLPIQRDLLNLVTQAGPLAIFNLAWAVSYESEKMVVFALPTSPTASEASIYYVYNKNTTAWYTYSFPQANLAHGVVDLNQNQLIMSTHTPASLTYSQAFQYWLERKNYNSTDHQDVSFTIASPVNSITNTMIFPSSYHGIGLGDLVTQIQGSLQLVQRVVGIGTTVNYNDTILLDSAPSIAWTSASLTIQKGITSTLQLLPIVGDSELVAKQFSDQIRLYFRYLDAEFFGSNVWTDEQPVSDAGQNGVVAVAAAWDTNQPWGSGVWGGQQAYNLLSRVTFAKTYIRAAELDLLLTFSNAATRWELEGITVGASASVTDRVVRGNQGGWASEGAAPTIASPATLLSLLIGGPTAGQIAQGAPIGLTAPVALSTDQGVAVTCSRSTPAMVLNAAGAPVLLGPNVLRIGQPGLLVEGAVTNNLIYSQMVATPTWLTSLSAGSLSTAPNTADVLAPDGTQTAGKLVFGAMASTGGNYCFLYQTSTGGVVPGRFSIWLRTLSGTATVYIGDNVSGANFATCSVTTTWQRFSCNAQLNGQCFVGFNNFTYSGQSTPGCTVYAWGAQAEASPFATSYFPTNTNTITNSPGLTTGWNSACTSGSVVATASTTPAPDGTLTATQLAFPTTLATLGNFSIWQIAVGAGSGCASVWLQSPIPMTVWIWKGGGGLSGTSYAQCAVTSTWTRFFFFDNASGQNGVNIGIPSIFSGFSTPAFNLNAWGPQWEAGSISGSPSQFMATGATLTTTRAADNIQVATTPTWAVNPFTISMQALPEGTWPQNGALDSGFGGFLFDWANGSTNVDRLYLSPATTAAQAALLFDDSAGDVTLGGLSGPPADALSHLFSIAYTGQNNLSTYSIDRVVQSSGTLATPRTIGAPILFLGQTGVNTAQFFGWLSNIKITTP